MAVLELPVVLALRASAPKAALTYPSVLERSALTPKAQLIWGKLEEHFEWVAIPFFQL